MAETKLSKYRGKRDFSKTSEPAGGAVAPGSTRFVVHKHSATADHYDLRLEHDGVLLSWAVPRGPSLDPADKRVVKASEMHEADYSPWEGRKMEAWPCLTVLRGKVVVENGVFKGSLADGQWQHRRIPSEMIAKPLL